MKACSRCGIERQDSDFYHKRAICKPCCRAQQKQYRQSARGKNALRKASKRYRQTENGKRVHADSKERMKKRHPDKFRARRQLQIAVQSGRVTKPKACEQCGRLATLHGHHEDYSKPLDVVWLCRSCHDVMHKGDRHAQSRHTERRTAAR